MMRIIERHLRIAGRDFVRCTRLWCSNSVSRPRVSVASSRPPRWIHTTPGWKKQDNPPSEPPSTDFDAMNMLSNTPVPSTSVDVCLYDGFGLNSGITISGGDGVLLVSGQAFTWRPWLINGAMKLVNEKGQFDLPKVAFGLFEVLSPRPDLLVIGVGKYNLPLSPMMKQHIVSLGMKVEVLDTRNAAAHFNLLATERGVSEVAAALIPLGWKEGVGAA
ncbi:hypothetical protein CP533_2707 [Ophiocordyceps camponoti-saundersi (nom. inval.)]|nr:hypothetical protein CP533_2707 [Ophiocordyceps camponoti-saundersi (nom. inval.)]